MLQSWLPGAVYLAIVLGVFILVCLAASSKAKGSDDDESSFQSEIFCPVCGNPMEAGYMTAAQTGVVWKSSLTWIPEGDDIFGQRYRVSYYYFAAHLCRQCGIIKYNPPSDQ